MIDISTILPVDEKEVQKTIETVKKEIEAAGFPDREQLINMLNYVDLTTLEGSDNAERIEQLCDKGLSLPNLGEDIRGVAAVCVYPPFVALAADILYGSGIKVASVAAAFPSGQLPLHLKVSEVEYAVEQGADEIDIVISRGTFLEGDYVQVYEEIAMMKEACGEAHLKVILETGELGTLTNIKIASKLAIDAGANFIKTSTGKIQPAATPEAACVMLMCIKEHFEATGVRIGFKPAGGISDPIQALLYTKLVEKILGKEWLNNSLFRIGASRLVDRLVDKIINN
jgi:deoxyribose-phosphate aldolase